MTPPNALSCYGTLCERHGKCARYQGVETSSAPTIATCRDSAGTYPMFIDSNTTIHWTHEMFVRFKAAYGDAVRDKVPDFKFDGHDFYTKYARYLIAYLSSLNLSSTI